MKDIAYKIPKGLIQAFETEALKNRSKNGHIETLALVAGTFSEGALVAKDLIFPNQKGTSSDVEDLGN